MLSQRTAKFTLNSVFNILKLIPPFTESSQQVALSNIVKYHAYSLISATFVFALIHYTWVMYCNFTVFFCVCFVCCCFLFCFVVVVFFLGGGCSVFFQPPNHRIFANLIRKTYTAMRTAKLEIRNLSHCFLFKHRYTADQQATGPGLRVSWVTCSH